MSKFRVPSVVTSDDIEDLKEQRHQKVNLAAITEVEDGKEVRCDLIAEQRNKEEAEQRSAKKKSVENAINELDYTNLNIEDVLELNEMSLSESTLRELLPNGLLPTEPNNTVQPHLNAHSRPRKQYSNNAARRLFELDFDPLEKLVRLHKDLKVAIRRLTHDEKGTPRTRTDKFGNKVPAYSTMTYASLLALEQKLLQDLMVYGYSKAPSTVTVENTKTHQGNTIVLTGEKYGRTFDHEFVPLPKDDVNE